VPLQNRVLPTGEIAAIPARGTLTGNRGIIHRDDKTLGTSRWSHHAWICCTLDWQGRKRPVMTGRNWTELFFLDESVAFAAGHRPCGYCRRSAPSDLSGMVQRSSRWKHDHVEQSASSCPTNGAASLLSRRVRCALPAPALRSSDGVDTTPDSCSPAKWVQPDASSDSTCLIFLTNSPLRLMHRASRRADNPVSPAARYERQDSRTY